MTLAKRWIYPDLQLEAGSQELGGFPALQRQILVRRGLRSSAEVEEFFRGTAGSETEPMLLHGMDRALDRLGAASAKGERVVVYGDYDADGVTATVLLFEVLRSAGFNADWYIPDRFQEGYGLNHQALADLAGNGAQLILTVDCGVRSAKEVQTAAEAGLEFIITDHHLPGEKLPAAASILNPHQPGDSYPFKGLAGVGIAYKLAQALHQNLGAPNPEELLDLVAIGTVADLAPLLGENRSLVTRGLERLNQTRRLGLLALMETAGSRLGSLNSDSIGFGLGPRLNAAGRLETARLAVQLLLADQADQAHSLARQLESLNRERQLITQRNIDLVLEALEDSIPPRNIVLAADQRLHPGVVGLAASRIAELKYRPALLLVPEGEVAKGSARSIPGFHITHALETCSDLLERFGGHEMAAGFAVATDRIADLEARLERLATQLLSEDDLVPSLELDGVVGFEELQKGLMEFFDRLEPCGRENPYPLLATHAVEILARRAVGDRGSHLKLTLRQGGVVIDAIAFRMGELAATLPELVDVAYKFERNEFRGYVTFQLNVQDIRAATNGSQSENR